MKKPPRFFHDPISTPLHDLMEQINFITCILEDEFERTQSPEFKAACQRSETRLNTLKKICAKKPIEAKALELLLEYHGVAEIKEILDYPHISNDNIPYTHISNDNLPSP